MRRAASAGGAGAANLGAAIGFGKSRNPLPWWRDFARVLRVISPRKPEATLRAWTGLSLRQCENIVAARTGTSVDVVRACLATEHGWEFLTALMGEAPPLWFQELRYQHESARLAAEIAEARAKVRELRRHK
jgi:hypothetical protein